MNQNNDRAAFAIAEQRVRPGWLLYIEGRGIFTVLEPNPDTKSVLVVPVQNNETGELSVFTVAQLDKFSLENVRVIYAPTAEALAKLRTVPAPPVEAVPASSIDQRLLDASNRIVKNLQLIESLLEEKQQQCIAQGVKFRRDRCLREICTILGDSNSADGAGRSNYYYYKNMLASVGGDPIRLAAALHRKTFQKTQASRAMQHFLDSVILTHLAHRGPSDRLSSLYELVKGYFAHTQGWWVDPEKCTDVPANLVDELMNVLIPIEVILQNPEKAALLTKIERPSRAGFYRYQRWFIANPEQGSKLMIARYGQEYYEKYLMCFDTYVHLASLPLQYVFADHCLIDIFIVDDETRTTVFRVWVTLLIDCYSRSILGIAILNQSPCIESIQSALANAIWDKTEFLRDLGLEYPEGKGWEIFGIPISLSLDNAWAHLSLSLENLCRNISCHGRFTGIELNFRPPYKGRYGAVIERYFGNLQAKIKEANLDGAIRNKSASGVRNSAKEARLLLYDIKRAVAQLIVMYQNTPHSELDGMTPNEKWREGMASGWPQVPERNPANERLFWRGDPQYT